MEYTGNYIFLGKFYPPRMLATIKEDSKGVIGFSNHNFEMSIVSGLIENDVNLRILTIPGVYSWPHNNKKLYTCSEKFLIGAAPVKSAGFLNIAVINKISMLFSALINLLMTYRKFDSKEIQVITNAPNIVILYALKLSKFLSNKRIEVTTIIPDIPAMVTKMHGGEGIKGRLVKWIDNKTVKLYEECDRHVLLTEAMTDFFDKPIKYIVMEGLIDENKYNYQLKEISTPGKIIILYTGSIHRQFGIMNLVEAFLKASLPQEVELWICGSGDASEELRKRADNNRSIKFWGLVDSEKAREMQYRASFLVNPRSSEHEFTKYSFPSKTLEYLASGKPVVMNRLPGMPKEYFNYVITPKDESIEQWANTLKKVVCMPSLEREKIGSSGRDFVLKHKNAKAQMERVVNFIIDS